MSKSQTILITGATSGIGRYAALYLARHGHHVIATGRKMNLLEELADEARGSKLDVLPLDVTDETSIREARAAADELTGGRGIDVLVNNAGYGIAAPMSEISDEDLRRQFDTNVFGLMAVTRVFVPQMRERGAGKIINVSSIGGRFTFPYFGAYNATKYAVESMSDAMRNELRPFGINVVLIEPGVIRTNFSNTTQQWVSEYSGPESPYVNSLAHADVMVERTDKMAVGPEVIARVMRRAVESRRPAARYMAPFKARIMYGMFKILPTSWADALMRRVAHLTPKVVHGPKRQLAPHREAN